MKDNKKNDLLSSNLMRATIMVVFIMSVSALCVIVCIDNWEQRGQFGDLFGVVNALFSGLAFAGLIITIRQQHQDLEYQKQAIEQTNQEMKSQTKEFDKQNETLRIERFENTFFKMLEVQQGIVNNFYEVDTYKQRVEEDSPDHHGFVRATLSRYELVMLYYNGLFHPKMKKMMERYCLLNNIRKRFLPMSRECYEFLENKGSDKERMYNAGFSNGDFEFYLTDDNNDVSKYYLGAFYTPKEISEGQALLERWRKFVNRKS